MNIYKKIFMRIFVLALCVVCVLFIARTQRASFYREKKSFLEVKDIRNIFPSAESITGVLQPSSQESFKEQDELFDVFDEQEKRIGKVLYSSEQSTYRGYAGDVPFIIGFDLSGYIIGVDIIHHRETPDVVRYLRNTKFFSSWNGLTAQQAFNRDVDAVSSATMTAEAVIYGVRQSLSALSDAQVSKQKRELRVPWLIASFFVLVFALASFLYPQKFSPLRFWLLCLSVLVFGFWGKEMLSLSQFFNWIIWLPQGFTALFFIFLLSVLISLFSGRGFYCFYVCPYGSLQEIIGRANKRKPFVAKKLFKMALILGWIYFWLIVAGLILGFPMALESFEPFSAFLFQGAALASLVIACLFLLISFFIPRAWCTFLCPTGKIFNLFKIGILRGNKRNI